MLRLQKYVFILLIIFIVGIVVLHLTWRCILFSSNTTKTKYILYWTPFWHQKDYYIGKGYEPFKHCEYKQCYATDNKSFQPLDTFDALIFHASYYKKYNGVPLPEVRKPHQKYIFMNMEAPVYYCPDLQLFNSYFNWTMSYRFDSDIVRRHGYIIQGRTNYTMPSKESLKSKTRLAAWFVSKCKTPSRREDLCNRIKMFIPVDVYGFCGNFSCETQVHNKKLSSEACYKMLERKYKFYFSFENSYCSDYSTEKLYNILRRDVIPVVYGAGDYTFSAPPNSFINVEDFESVEDLTDYLRYLDKNTHEYLKYFEWKKKYSIDTSTSSVACQICKKLHEPLVESVYHDLHKWWWERNSSVCKTDKDLPAIVSDLIKK